jgi:hypothetical protein
MSQGELCTGWSEDRVVVVVGVVGNREVEDKDEVICEVALEEADVVRLCIAPDPPY